MTLLAKDARMLAKDDSEDGPSEGLAEVRRLRAGVPVLARQACRLLATLQHEASS